MGRAVRFGVFFTEMPHTFQTLTGVVGQWGQLVSLNCSFLNLLSQMATVVMTIFLQIFMKNLKQILAQKIFLLEYLLHSLTTIHWPCPRTLMLQKRSCHLKKDRSLRWDLKPRGTNDNFTNRVSSVPWEKAAWVIRIQGVFPSEVQPINLTGPGS